MKLLHILLLTVFLYSVSAEDKTVEEANGVPPMEPEEEDYVKEARERGEKVMSYKQPSLTDEEQHSHHFPDRYRCEACQIVTHNLGSVFQKFEKRIPKKQKRKKLSEVDVIEIVENLCDKSGFDKYSMQEFSGTVTFKGPAFPGREAPGMSMGGGLWPARYVNYCGSLMEDLYEDEVYEWYRQGNLFHEMCFKNHCKHLKEIPEAVNFKHTLAEDEQICKANDKKCKHKLKSKDEL